MPKHITSPFHAAQQGVVLIEAMIAILIFSIGVLGIVGMQANMIKNSADSKYRSDAAYVAQQTIGEIWIDSALQANPASIQSDVSAVLPNGTRTVTQLGTQYTVEVDWQQPGEGAHKFVTVANIVP